MTVEDRFSIEHWTKETIAHNFILEKRFRSAEAKVEGFRQAGGRLPSEAEFKRLVPSGGEVPMLFPHGFADCNASSDQQSELRGAPYILAIWRRDWMECYAPSVGVSTLAFKPARFTVTGSLWQDKLASVMLLIGCVVIAAFLWQQQPAPLRADEV